MSRRLLLLVAAVLLAATSATRGEDARPKQLLIIGDGPDGHPPATHEFMAGAKVLARLLEGVEGLQVTVVDGREPFEGGAEKIAGADGVVLLVSQGARWMQTDTRRYDALARLCKRGGGLTALHWAVGAHDARYIDGQLKLLGGTRGGPQRKYTVVETDVTVADPKHPAASGVKDFRVRDEFYYRLDLAKGIRPLLTAKIDGSDETVSWTWERPDGGRSFGFVMLHFHDNWRRQDYRRLVSQGVLWTLGLDVPKEGRDVKLDEQVYELPKREK